MLTRSVEDSARRASLARGMVMNLFQRARGDSLMLPDTLTDRNSPAQVATTRMHFTGGVGARAAGPVMLLSLPFTLTAEPARFTTIIDRMDDPDNPYSHDPRRLPIDGAKIFAPATRSAELIVQLPDGWKAQLPKHVNATGPFGIYTSEYSQNGRVVSVRRVFTGSRAVVPKEEYPALLTWMKLIAADKIDYIVLEPAK